MDNEQLHQESADSTNLLYSTVQLKRIADALEEVLRLVKEDQERSRARFEEEWDKKDE
jgi:Na+/phosphate symporter